MIRPSRAVGIDEVIERTMRRCPLGDDDAMVIREGFHARNSYIAKKCLLCSGNIHWQDGRYCAEGKEAWLHSILCPLPPPDG